MDEYRISLLSDQLFPEGQRRFVIGSVGTEAAAIAQFVYDLLRKGFDLPETVPLQFHFRERPDKPKTSQ